MRRTRLPALLLLLLLPGSCSGGPEEDKKGSGPRYPDDQGVVTRVTFERVELDARHAYPVSLQLESFSTYNRKVIPLLSWKGKYVHVGLDKDRKVVWVAGIGVVDRSVDPPVVYYVSGVIERVNGKRRAIFEDGTVLRLADGVRARRSRVPVKATINTATDEVIELIAQ